MMVDNAPERGPGERYHYLLKRQREYITEAIPLYLITPTFCFPGAMAGVNARHKPTGCYTTATLNCTLIQMSLMRLTVPIPPLDEGLLAVKNSTVGEVNGNTIRDPRGYVDYMIFN